jgi:hypothetical protein
LTRLKSEKQKGRWFCLPLGSVISSAFFNVMEEEDWIFGALFK